MSKTIAVRLTAEQNQIIEQLKKDTKQTNSVILKELLEIGIKNYDKFANKLNQHRKQLPEGYCHGVKYEDELPPYYPTPDKMCTTCDDLKEFCECSNIE